MRRMGWVRAGLAMAALLVAGESAYGQGYGWDRHDDRYQRRRMDGFVERQGGTQRFYDRRGDYEGHSERSAGGGVRRFYDSEGRYLGREEVQRDFRRRWPRD